MLIPKFHIAFCFVFFLLAKQFCYAQTPLPNDCIRAIQLCQDTPYNQGPSSESGNTQEINKTNANTPLCFDKEGEINSVWFTFTVFKDGDLLFQINPTNPDEDYDFAVFKNHSCGDLSTPAVRCNHARVPPDVNTVPPLVSTGLQLGATATYQSSLQSNQCAPLTVLKDETYALVVTTTGTFSGFSLDFGGSTASIHDTIPPIITFVYTDSCSPYYADIYFSRKILSRSFIANDFTITGPSPSSSSVVISNVNDYSDMLEIRFADITVAGIYTITTNTKIYDECGNYLPEKTTYPFTVKGAKPKVTATMLKKSTCNNEDGEAVMVSGGTLPYKYLWNDPKNQTTQTATSLAAGYYCCTVTDANECSDNSCVSITDSGGVTLCNVAVIDASCSAYDGSIELVGCVETTPGVYTSTPGAYTYLWSPGGKTTAKIDSLAEGPYTVIVTATATTCTATATYQISKTPLTYSITITNAGCTTADGSATIFVSDAVTYSWSNGQTIQTATGLSANTPYTVTVTDSKGCTIVKDTTIGTTLPPSLGTPGRKDATCGFPNGEATFFPTGGSGSYSYLWDANANSQTTQTADSLLGGIDYLVTITDTKSGCSTLSVAKMANGSPIVFKNSTIPVSCKGGSDGSVTLNLSGGTPPFTYLWSNGNSTNMINGLIKGNYTVTVISTGCPPVDTTITINELAVLSATITAQTNVLCKNGTTGSATVTAIGGTSPYTYSWSNSSVQTTATGLSATTYTATVTDANGCKDSSTVTLTEPTLLLASTTVTNETCDYSNDGTATALANGGTSPYTYLWASGDTTPTVSGLQEGTYSVTATDSNGCTANAIAIISQPDTLAINDTIQNVSCSGRNDGFITTSPSGGTAPYTYLWDNYTYIWANTPTTQTISGLTTGGFVVTITDSKGCSITSDILVVWDRLPLLDSISTTPATCSYLNNGTAIANTSVGTFDYTYLWQPGNSTSMSISGLQGGTYSVTVSDYLGCDTTATVVISQPQPLAINFIGRINVKCFGGNDGAVSTSISGGTPNYLYSWSPKTATTTAISNLTAGTYSLTVTDSKGCIATDSVTIITINQLPIVIVNSTSICKGLGSSTLTASGAASYVWSNGNIIASTTISPTRTTSYTVTGTDVKGCSGTTVGTVTVFQIPVAQFSASPNPAGVFEPVVTFTDQSSPDVNYWNWNFGDGDTLAPNTASPAHTYPSVETIYTVTLIVHNAGFCFDTISHQVVIGPEYAFYIPNAFTPDGDGINDLFFGKGVGIIEYELMIFDRWGLFIFYADDINKAWDGKVNGGVEAAQQDVYIWKVRLTDVFKKKHEFIGTVTIVK